MTDPIKAALEKAGRANCTTRAKVHEWEPEPCATVCRWCSTGSATAIVAFLDALPPHQMRAMLGHGSFDTDGTTTKKLAAAVRAAGGGE